MKLLHKGQAVQPLERLTLSEVSDGTLRVSDGMGRVYVERVAAPETTFTVGGALGYHNAILTDTEGQEIDRLTFRVDTRTAIRDDKGIYGELLQILYYSMITEADAEWSETSYVRYNGRIYRFFVRWIRDHVHVLKGMKYFATDLKDGIDLFRNSQREDGMIWDNVYPRSGLNYWDMRFKDGDFIRPFEDGTAEFKRIPVEADVEYLFVEGLYYTWKATGDDQWMRESLDSAIKALDYCVTDPYRWSEVYGLIKRGYTIDTWDFQNEYDSTINNDAMRVDLETTRYGIMYGDNTGCIASSRYLAEMLDFMGRTEEAVRFRQRADEIEQRLNMLSWNGRFFTHHIREDQSFQPDFGVDEASQVSLSNAYSLNRGISSEQAQAIVRTYQGIRDNLPEGSPGEWYTIYPPFGRGFGDHNGLWHYMNGGVTPIVAGELAHGAFEHGFEAYGVNILDRVYGLAKAHGDVMHRVYVGAKTPAPERNFVPLDLSDYANIDFRGEGAEGVPGWTGEGINDLYLMPVGEQTLAGIPFHIPDPEQNGRRGAIGLFQREGYAQQVEIPVGQRASSVYFVHAVSQTGMGGIGGLITLHYRDGTTFNQYVVRGQNVSGWWFPEAPKHERMKICEVGWRGANRVCIDVGVIAYGLENPHPEREIEKITLTAAADGGFWAVLGITLSDSPVYFDPSPFSYGIPNSWGAAAVVYALIEGLAGVVDTATMYGQVKLSPRWSAAGVNEVEVSVKYPDSNGYVSYRYRHNEPTGTVELEMTGSGEGCQCHILLPHSPVSVYVDGNEVGFEANGKYADFTLNLCGAHQIVIGYR